MMESVRYLVLLLVIFHEISDSYVETHATKVNETLEIQTWSFTFWMNKKTTPKSLVPLKVRQTGSTTTHQIPGSTKRLLKRRRTTTQTPTTTTKEYSMYEYYDSDATTVEEEIEPKASATSLLPTMSLPSTTLLPTTILLTTTPKIIPFKAETRFDNSKKLMYKNYFNSKKNPSKYVWAYMDKPRKNDGMKWVSAYRQRFIPKLPLQRFKPPTTTEDPYPYDDDYSELEIEKNCGEGLIFFDGGCFPDVS